LFKPNHRAGPVMAVGGVVFGSGPKVKKGSVVGGTRLQYNWGGAVRENQRNCTISQCRKGIGRTLIWKA